jgi:hypothetical protein
MQIYGVVSILTQILQNFLFQTFWHHIVVDIFQLRLVTFPTCLKVHPKDGFSITILTGVSKVNNCIG